MLEPHCALWFFSKYDNTFFSRDYGCISSMVPSVFSGIVVRKRGPVILPIPSEWQFRIPATFRRIADTRLREFQAGESGSQLSRSHGEPS